MIGIRDTGHGTQDTGHRTQDTGYRIQGLRLAGRIVGRISVLCVLLGLSFSVSAAEHKLIEGFEYNDAEVARAQWQEKWESGPVGVVLHPTEKGKTALSLPCDFSRLEDRGCWDKRVKLDLVKHGRFSLWIYVDNASAVDRGSIYFKSGKGWYGGHFSLTKNGWQQIVISRYDFHPEGSPAGWHKIDGIRISFWSGKELDVNLAVDDLMGISDEIVVVRGAAKKKGDERSINQLTAFVGELLSQQGLEHNLLSAKDVERGALAGCRLAVFPFHPDMSNKTVRAAKKFIKSGGKVILFYSVPDKLAAELGIKKLTYRRRTESGREFHTLRLKEGALAGELKGVLQDSYNIMVPELGASASVIGEWVNDKGIAGGIPALVLHENGIYMGHVLLKSDQQRKSELLLELMGQLLPEMWPIFSEAVYNSIGRVAGFSGTTAVEKRIQVNSGVESARGLLAAYSKLRQQAELRQGQGEYREVINLSRQAKLMLRRALLLSFPSRGDEFRAVWCHDARGIRGWSWDRSVKWLKHNGIDNLVGNFLWGGGTSYPSRVLPLNDNYQGKGDQLAACLAACRKYGVKLHVWKVNWELWWGSPEEFVDKLRAAGRLQQNEAGEERKCLCPSHPDNFKLEVESMLEVVENYQVDGLHFDYIRYPDEHHCFCDGCRERFEKHLGKELDKWPEDVLKQDEREGEHHLAWQEWRCANITRLVKAVSEKAHKIRPGIKLSAAVFDHYPHCIKTVAQDWLSWVKAGYLDFVCPMDYRADNTVFKHKVIAQLELVGDKIPLYPGIGASSPGLSSEQIALQIQLTRELGAPGFIIFNYALEFAEGKLPELRKAVLAVE